MEYSCTKYAWSKDSLTKSFAMLFNTFSSCFEIICHKILVKTSLTRISKRMPAQSHEGEHRLCNKKVMSQL